MTRRFLGYGRQSVGADDLQAVADVLNGDFLTQGPALERFESALAERVGASHAVAVSSGTAALHVAGLAAGMEAGQRGLTSAITFVASANCMRYCGASAGFLDIDPETLGMPPSALAAELSRDGSPTVIVPVHMGGLAAAAADIRQSAGTRTIIEDASHALGGTYEDGKPVGCCAHSDMTVFSFHPVKPITTAEGGAVTTNDAELARLLRLYRNHGIERQPENFEALADGEPAPGWWYEQHVLGFNYRLNDIQAALGASQLSKLDGFVARRREIARYYDDAFDSVAGLRPVQASPDHRARSALHLYIVDVDWAAAGHDRGSFMAALAADGVGSQVHYIPVYRHPYHHEDGIDPIDRYPHAEAYYRGCLSLPLHQGLSDEDVEHVADTVRKVLQS